MQNLPPRQRPPIRNPILHRPRRRSRSRRRAAGAAVAPRRRTAPGQGACRVPPEALAGLRFGVPGPGSAREGIHALGVRAVRDVEFEFEAREGGSGDDHSSAGEVQQERVRWTGADGPHHQGLDSDGYDVLRSRFVLADQFHSKPLGG